MIAKEYYFKRGKHLLCRCAAIMAVLIIPLTLSSCSADKAQNPETDIKKPAAETAAESAEAGFDSPEAAVKAYLEGLQNQDLDHMMRSFAIENYIDGCSLQAQTEFMMLYRFGQQSVDFPSGHDFARSLDLESRRSAVTSSIKWQFAILCGLEMELFVSSSGGLTPEDVTAQISKQLNALDLSSLKISGFVPPSSLFEYFDEEANQNNLMKRAELIGANQFESRIGIIEIGKRRYLMFFDTIEYDGRWYLLELGGYCAQLAGISTDLPGIAPLTNDEYKELKRLIEP